MAQKGRQRKSKKWITAIIFLVLIAAAGVMCYFVWDAYFKPKPKPKEDGSVVGIADNKKEEDKIEVKSEDPVEKPKIEQYDGNDPNTSASLTGALTYVGVTDGNLRLRVNIDQYLSSGSCNLVLSRNGSQIYSDSASIVDSASTSTCEGFDIATSALGSGNLLISISISSGGKTGTITGEATV